MSKTIKLENSVYNRLEEVRDKRETFSQAVGRLLDLRGAAGAMRDVLESAVAATREKHEQLAEQTKIIR